MKILITGSNGLLGQKIVKLCIEQHLDFLATSQGENRNSACPMENYKPLDISQETQINAIVDSFQPTHIIHTAAITNVDYCEDHPEECQRVNVVATQFLFDASKQRKIHFQLLSTDFVFDGENGPYSEEDSVNPLSVYAKSKVDAERILHDSEYTNWSISRTIIVYGTGENLSRSNIVLWALDSLKNGNEMNIVDDQFRMPTWADDLAWACVEICKRSKTGVFHLSGDEFFSMFDLVLEIARLKQLDTSKVKSISSSSLNQAAKRPPKTGFILDKAKRELDYSPTSLSTTIELLEQELKRLNQ
jgi:dTDP-4-dehydrorhamnose reductase